MPRHDEGVGALNALVCRNSIGRRQAGRFNLDVVQNDWRQNHSRYSHEALADDQREQGEPDGIFDPITDDLAVQKIFQLVKRDQEHERRNRNAR